MTDSIQTPKPATEATRRANAAARERLPLSDRRDYDDAARGFLGTLADPVIRRADGVPVFDVSAHDFVQESDEAPDSVHPSLWRHAQVNHHHGLFEVVPGIYQVRGLDISNMTIVEGDEGILVIDPLVYDETAAAALALYREHRGDRAVKALIYTHSHADHYGGAKAVLDPADVEAGRAVVIAPEGFLSEAVAENVYAGTAMTRRALYQYGPMLQNGVRGQVDAGLANGVANLGSASLIPPTDLVSKTSERRTVDGVEMVFQMAPGTEAPAEFLIHFPQHRALCAAEDATHTMHNLYTLRGAQVRDAATWWKTLDRTIELFGAETDVVFAQHAWPRWGAADIVEFLGDQRDLYKYLHDESLRLANHGHTAPEIAEQLRLPAGLDRQWYSHGYYGSTSHNAKAVYQRYLGWYDSHPAHLNPLPPEQSAVRYVDVMGGADAILAKAQESFDAGDYRWVAEVLTHVVFADPANAAAAALQADALEQLGYQSENPTWRNEYLMGAFELRNGVKNLGEVQLASADVLAAMTPEMLFDYLGIKLDGVRAAGRTLDIAWTVVEGGAETPFAVQLRNGVLIYSRERTLQRPDIAVQTDKGALTAVVFGALALEEAQHRGDFVVSGDEHQAFPALFDLFDRFPLWFNIVQP